MPESVDRPAPESTTTSPSATRSASSSSEDAAPGTAFGRAMGAAVTRTSSPPIGTRAAHRVGGVTGRPRRDGYTTAVTAPLSVVRSGAGEPLLLLHGWGSSRRDFAAVLPALAERFDVLNVELPCPLGGRDRPVGAQHLAGARTAGHRHGARPHRRAGGGAVDRAAVALRRRPDGPAAAAQGPP